MKKRIWSILLSLCMVLSLLPAAALAADEGEDGGETEVGLTYYVNPIYAGSVSENDLLTWEEAKALDAAQGNDAALLEATQPFEELSDMADYVRGQMRQRVNAITFTCKGGFPDTTELINEVLLHNKTPDSPKNGDYILYQYAGYVSGGIGSGGVYTVNLSVTYYTTAEQETQVDAKVNELKTSLKLTDSSLSKYQKVKNIHDWIKANVKYDYDFSTGDAKYTAYGACCNKEAVCQGYSVLFYRLAMEAGIDARVISGTGNGGPHAWNIAQLDDNWYYLLDCTWDENTKSDNYFLRGRTWFYGTDGDHTPGTSPEEREPHLYNYASNNFNKVISTKDYESGDTPQPQPKQFTVTFDPNGGWVYPRSMTATNGQTYGELPTPNWYGYKFDGWYTAKSGGTQVTNTTTVSLTDDQTLYAHWTEFAYIFYGLGSGWTGDLDISEMYASTEVENKSGNGGLIVFAVYFDGAMVECAVRQLDVEKGSTKEYSVEFTSTITATEETKDTLKFRVYILDPLTFAPLCESTN